jgi:hypothetical protein
MNEYKCPYCGVECSTIAARDGHMAVCTRARVVGAPIIAGVEGSDTDGFGTWELPYKTLTKALSMVDANHPNIVLLPGAYEEAAMIVWPSITGISVTGLGPVTITNIGAGAAVIDIHPYFSDSTLEVTLKDITIVTAAQIGLQIDNAHMSKKLNVYLDGVDFEADSTGDSISVTNTVTTQAIRLYAKGCSFEGLVHIESLNAGCRNRFTNCDFIGNLTTTGAVVSEVALLGCVLVADATIDGTQHYNTIGCVHRSDADPAMYTEVTDAVAT